MSNIAQMGSLPTTLQPLIKGLAHIGYIVDDLQNAIAQCQSIYGVSEADISVHPPFEQTKDVLTRFAFINVGNICFELIEALSEPFKTTLANSPVAGGGLNHIAWYVSDIEKAVDVLAKENIYPGYVTPEGIVQFSSKKMVYLNPADTHGHLIELIEEVEGEQ